MESLSDFHFLRPLWFLALLPLAWLCHRLWQQRQQSTGMEAWIDRHLLSYLSSGTAQQPSVVPIIGLALLWFVVVVALAGPTWEKRLQPVYQSESAVVIVLDLSPSMNAADIKPSRIKRAHLKIQDFLSTRKEGLTALIVYGGEAFVVTPLTDDKRTISNLLPTLTPGILPIPGSNVEMAVELAQELVAASGINKSSLLLITDDIDQAAIKSIPQKLSPSMNLTILGVGSDDGAPIPNKGDFLKDSSGNMIIAKRNSQQLEKLAQQTGGYYLPLQADSSDIDFYTRHLQQRFYDSQQQDEENRSSDTWHEFGPTLLLFCLPLIALCFRRGWLLTLTLIGFTTGMTTPQTVYANEANSSWWQSLWVNPDQRGYKNWQNENYSGAAKQFNDPQWQGSAHYKQGDYDAALAAFGQDKTAIGDYNRGNAHAMKGEFDQAIKAYDQALEKDPALEAAKLNKQRIEELKNQQQQQQQNQGDKDQSEQGQSQQDQQSQSQENAENSSEQQQKQQQQGDQQSSQSEQQRQEQNASKQQSAEANEEKSAESQSSEQTAESNEEQQQALAQYESDLSPEEQQALQQWLRKVPDDPSGLLKRKFEYEFRKRKRLYQQGEWQLPENNAHKRY